MIEISSRAVPFDEFSTVLRVAAVFFILPLLVFFILPLLSFTALADQKKAPVPEKERTRGDFTVNINLAFPVFSSGPETYGYEAVGFGYTFLNNNLEAGINLGGIVTKGTLYTDSRMRGMAMGTAYLSLLFGKKTGKLTTHHLPHNRDGRGLRHHQPCPGVYQGRLRCQYDPALPSLEVVPYGY